VVGQKGDVGGDECKQAKGEMEKAQAVTEPPDKLFHYRRALRLCPTNPDYQTALGDLYLSFKRRADAEYQYKEALKIDPSHGPAAQKLRALKGN
jgi:tetratricopeptide (TPR) repeat protein